MSRPLVSREESIPEGRGDPEVLIDPAVVGHVVSLESCRTGTDVELAVKPSGHQPAAYHTSRERESADYGDHQS